MHRLARMGLAALGLALAVPTVGRAQQPAPSPPPAAPTHKHPRNIFGREVLCTECQRARAMAKDKVYIAPAPPLPPGSVVMRDGHCVSCDQAGAVASAPMMAGPVVPGGPVVAQGNGAPGRAVVGGDAPGRASVGGDEMLAAGPTPVGRAALRESWASARRTGPDRQAKAPNDGAIQPTSFNPVPPPGGHRPHILQHLFGLDAIGSLSREQMERRARENHASIAYGQKEQKVNELPSSMVYGR